MCVNFFLNNRTILIFVFLASATILAGQTTLSFSQHQFRELYQPSKKQSLKLINLEKGKTYGLKIVSKSDCEFQLRTEAVATTAFSNQENQIIFTANHTEQVLHIIPSSEKAELTKDEVWLSGKCLDCAQDTQQKESANQEKVLANIQTSQNLSLTQLITDVFIGGGCFEVSNVQAIGYTAGIGEFSQGEEALGIDEGIILTTGLPNLASGPNNSGSAGFAHDGFFSPSGDPDLEQLTSEDIYDPVGIEFDFVPTLDMISFDYVFASDEYCEFVNAGYNDVFGFFISGPGISGGFTSNGENIALIPGTNTPVAIDNINHISNTGLFVSNETFGCGTPAQVANVLEYDGLTTVLTAVASVIPCETYHIRLVIGDAGDEIYDSAVFLAANSFNAGGTASGEAFSSASSSNIVYEGCQDGAFIFTREGGDINEDLVVDFVIDPSSTATQGIDYINFPSSITIPAGSTTVSIPITVLNDNLAEGSESIIIELENSCECSASLVEFIIQDLPTLSLDIPDQTLCGSQSITLSANPTGGIPGYTYNWSTNATTPSITVNPTTGTENYFVTVTDNCGGEVIDEVSVTVSEAPTASISGSGMSCPGSTNTFDFEINLSGSGPWEINYSIDGVPQATISTSNNPYILQANQIGTYTLDNVTYSGGLCPGTVSGLAQINEATLSVSGNTSPIECNGAATGSISITPTGTAPYTYNWESPLASGANPSGLPAGTYPLTVTDFLGCEIIDSYTIDEATAIDIFLENINDIDCNNPAGNIDISVVGGSPNYNFNWSTGANTEDLSGVSAGNYTVSVTDLNNCLQTFSAIVTDNTDQPTIITQPPLELSCTNDIVGLNAVGSSTGNNYAVTWTGPGIVSGANSLNPIVNQAGDYEITISNTLTGCVNSSIVSVNENSDLPAVNIAAPPLLDCNNSLVTLDGTGSATGSAITYQWNGPGIVNGANTLTPLINQGGTYTLTVANTNTGCSSDLPVEVLTNFVLPEVAAIPSGTLTCSTTELSLDGTGSATGSNFMYEWTSTDGNIVAGNNTLTPLINAAGTYELNVFNTSTGCSNSTQVVITTDTELPDFSLSEGGVLDCNISELTLTGSLNNGTASDFEIQWESANGNIVSGENELSAIISAAGIYQLTITNPNNGCSDSQEVEITQDADVPVAQATATNDLNCTFNTVQINAENSTTGDNITFAWSTDTGNFVEGENSLNPIVDAPGIYTLSLINTENDCENTTTVQVFLDNQIPQINLADTILTCSTPTVQINTEGTDSGENFSFEWQGNFDSGTEDLTPLISSSGMISLTVTNNTNGCTASAEAEIFEDFEAPIINPGANGELNCTVNEYQIEAELNDENNPIQLSWTTDTGNIVSGLTTLSPLVNAPGNYQLNVTNTNNGCSSDAIIEVTQNIEQPSIDIQDAEDLTCTVTELALTGSATATGNLNYQWTTTSGNIINGENTLNPLVNAPGIYLLSVTNTENNCATETQVEVEQNTQSPTANAGQNFELSCNTSQVNLAGTAQGLGTLAYQWTTNNGNIISGQNELNPIINAAGLYILQVTDTENGCTSSAQTEVTQDENLPNAFASANDFLSCVTESVQINSTGTSTGPEFTYQWTSSNGNILSGANTPTPVVNLAGVYELTVSNTINGCQNNTSVEIIENITPPNASIEPATLLTCDNTTLSLNAENSDSGTNIQYNWTSDDGNFIDTSNPSFPQIDAPGTYTLQLLNTENGCSSETSISIQEDTEVPLLSIPQPNLLTCATQETVLNADVSSVGTFNYLWTTTEGNILSDASTASPTINQAGTYTVSVTNTATGCSTTSTVTAEQNIDLPFVEAGTTQELTCTETTVQLTGSSETQGEFSYNWQGPGIINGSTSLEPTVDASGIYTLTITNINTGCSSSDNVEVTLNNTVPNVLIAEPAVLNCLVDSIELNAQNSSTGTQFSYIWTSSNGNILSGETALTPIINAAGVYTLSISNEENGCTNEANVSVSANTTLPQVEAGDNQIIACEEGATVLLEGSSNIIENAYILWSSANDSSYMSNNLNTEIDAPGSYVLTVTDLENGCSNSDELSISQDLPVGEIEANNPICEDDLGQIKFQEISGGTPSYVYSINNGLSFTDVALFTDVSPGTYSAIIQDANGCEWKDIVSIEAAEPVLLSLETQVTISLGESYQLNLLSNIPEAQIDSVSWTPAATLTCDDCMTPIATPTQTTSYEVYVSDDRGCFREDNITILVKKEDLIYVPNAFSPNNDGENEVFMIYAQDNTVKEIKSFLVFDRWGENVLEYYKFLPNNPAFGWDGTHKGIPLNPAVFVWYAEVELRDGSVILLEGDVTLVK